MNRLPLLLLPEDACVDRPNLAETVGQRHFEEDMPDAVTVEEFVREMGLNRPEAVVVMQRYHRWSVGSVL